MNEFDFIRQLREQTRSRKASPRVIAGIGDDASVIRQSANRDLVITTDLLIEEIDFHRASAPPHLLGHKALAVSLSDIAAMGARPFCSLVSVGLPKDVWNSGFKDEFFAGYLALADRYGATLAGGDVSESKEKIVIDSIVVGEVAAGRAVLRSTTRPGDQIFVTGTLGGAAAGLKLIELGARVSEPPAVAGGPRGSSSTVREGNEGRQEADGRRHVDANNSDDDAIQALLLRQLSPEPRVGWGIVLGEERLATAMIDISDGLSSDLAHLCNQSGVGAAIDAASLPLDDYVKQLCGRRALDPLALALHGGEDFELLFTVAPENAARLPKRVDGVSISRIGEVTDKAGAIRVREKNREWELQPEGFTHFGKSNHLVNNI
jgi:thiamine-monophosphate kinase